MSRLFVSLVLVTLLAVSSVAMAAECDTAGSCAGGVFSGCEREYNHLKNWRFEGSNCAWFLTDGATRDTGGGMCEGTFSSGGYGKLVPPQSGYTTKIYQNLTPHYQSGFGDQWIVGYNLEFEDPYASSLNTVRVKVVNLSTSATIAQGTLHRGNHGDPNCYNYTFTFTASLDNVPVRLEVLATWAGSTNQDTFAAIDNIVLANLHP